MSKLTIVKGDTKVINAQVLVADTPVDITAATFSFTVKNALSDDDDDAIFQKTVGSGITVVDAADGRLRITIAPGDTKVADVTNSLNLFEYDLEMTLAGNIYTIAGGALVIKPQVTIGA